MAEAPTPVSRERVEEVEAPESIADGQPPSEAPVGGAGEVYSDAILIGRSCILQFLKLRHSACLKPWRIWLPRQEFTSSHLYQQSLLQSNWKL